MNGRPSRWVLPLVLVFGCGQSARSFGIADPDNAGGNAGGGGAGKSSGVGGSGHSIIAAGEGGVAGEDGAAGEGGAAGLIVDGSDGGEAGAAGDGGGEAGAAGDGGGGAAGGSGGGGGAQSACPTLPTVAVASKDIVQFNDNGGWSWYQDERAVVDAKAGKFIIGSVANGGSRDSDQEAVIYEIATGARKTYTLQSDLNPDDHNAPAFVIRPDGKYAATWATFNDTCSTYYSVFDGAVWSNSKVYDWKLNGCPWDSGSSSPHQISSANPWYLSSEDKVFSAVRSVSTSPAFLSSSDGGSSWNFYGRITATPITGYVAGYYKYWGNGADRIDFVGTEAHPRDNNNSLWHGYYKAGKLYDSTDKLVDDSAGDTNAQTLDKFSLVFAQGTTANGITPGTKLYRLWNHDLVRYADGTIAVTGQGRTSNAAVTADDDPDKRMIYSRWDGASWKSTYLVKAGPKLYSDEQDYTGLSALHPDNPNVIFVSSTYDPRTDMEVPSKKHELFMGVTCDKGATFKWAPLTENSAEDNIRPIVPKWDSSHTLLLWLKGSYTSAQKYSLKVVGTTALQFQ